MVSAADPTLLRSARASRKMRMKGINRQAHLAKI
jgi:hypothetical protein